MKTPVLMIFFLLWPQTNLLRILDRARHHDNAVFTPPPKPLYDLVKTTFRVLAKQDDPCDKAFVQRFNKTLTPLGMEFVKARYKDMDAYVLRERQSMFHGRGVFVVRCGQAKPICIQAPHGFFDKKTFKIGFSLFLETRARWFMTNTVPRYKSRPGETPATPPHPADCAHNENLLFQAVTEGIVNARPDTLFVQIHGFTENKHKNKGIVISTGARHGNDEAVMLAGALKSLPFDITVYGKDADELGATTNAQARLIRRHKGYFLHMECSQGVRAALVGNPAMIRGVAKAIQQVAAGMVDGHK